MTPIDEFRLYLQGFPEHRFPVLNLSKTSKQAILAALSVNLNDRKLRSKGRRRLFKRIAYARVAYDRLASGEQTVPVLWTKKHENELKRIRGAAKKLAGRLKQCSSAARTRFGHCGIDGVNNQRLRRLVDQILTITHGAYEHRPQIAPPNRGDFAYNALVALLAMAWEQATRRRLTRSNKRHKSPAAFVQATLKEIGITKCGDSAIQTALLWLLRHRRARDQIRRFAAAGPSVITEDKHLDASYQSDARSPSE